MDTNRIIELIDGKLTATLEEMGKAQKLDDQVKQSQVVKNLSEALQVFLSMPCGYQPNDISEDDEAEITTALDDKLA